MMTSHDMKIEFARASAFYLRHARAAIAAYGDETLDASLRPSGMSDTTWLTLVWTTSQMQAGVSADTLKRQAKEASRFDRVCANS